ncbi:hypothetical protein SAMN02744037_01567 [Tepidibacter formicigenes DSM 15518]|uniref:Uncharacterized protein n=1 Tax=Tepidibacter formicigenes DSM 15518 TaxID=1123349 RepID=A0A1M6PHL8_9FIRM|nr:hypothetical protein SAMN02744037_01567 [Tepidibacter formicigenes DSM 15518]
MEECIYIKFNVYLYVILTSFSCEIYNEVVKNKKLTNLFWQSKYHALSVRGWEVASKGRRSFPLRCDIASADRKRTF